MNSELLQKYENLKSYISSFGKVAVAFSAGVDSTFLLYAAKEALGSNVLALTAASCSFPERELKEAREYCEGLNVRQQIIHTQELKIEGFAQNPKNRCYLCKRELFREFREAANEQDITEILEGSNLDDNRDYRPGLQAVAELGIRSPLRTIGFTKNEIRELSQYLKLPTWDKPSFACLASRFPYGDPITEEKLRMIDQAEQLLLNMGFHQLRVRIHGDVARIELDPEEFDRFMQKEIRTTVFSKFREFGFGYVSLDILGYRTGSMNEMISAKTVTDSSPKIQ